jgi:hypothetical protein
MSDPSNQAQFSKEMFMKKLTLKLNEQKIDSKRYLDAINGDIF